MKIEFLPPYSPDHNPIELSFSMMKSWLRNHYEIVVNTWDKLEDMMAVPDLLFRMLNHIPQTDVQLWFKKCGLDVN